MYQAGNNELYIYIYIDIIYVYTCQYIPSLTEKFMDSHPTGVPFFGGEDHREKMKLK